MRRLWEVIFGLICVVALALVLSWSALSRAIAYHDLLKYGQVVRASSLSLNEKERLLDLTDTLTDRVRGGEKIALWRWLETDSAVRPILAELNGEEDVRLIERELERFEKGLEDP